MMTYMACKDCEKRVLACHDTCEDYQRFHQKRKAMNEKRWREGEMLRDDRLTTNYHRKLKRQLG